MLVLGSKKAQLWFTTALLLLSSSICPRSCYPHAEEDEDPLGPEDNLENVEDQQSVPDPDDQDWEEEESLTEESDDDVENGPTQQPCIQSWLPCEPITTASKNKVDECCGKPDFVCRTSRINGRSFCDEK